MGTPERIGFGISMKANVVLSGGLCLCTTVFIVVGVCYTCKYCLIRAFIADNSCIKVLMGNSSCSISDRVSTKKTFLNYGRKFH